MANSRMKRVVGTGVMFAATFMVMASMAQSSRHPAATVQMVKAANAFLATLDAKQRQTVLFAFDDEVQRARWSNFPTGFVPRGGIDLRDMTPAQRAAGMALLASALSPRGYEKVQQIMEGDEVNKTMEQKNPGGPGGGRPPRDNNGPPPGGGNGPPPGSGNPGGGDRPGFGGGLSGDLFGKDLYYFSILGTPSETNPWMLQFGGHHLALNITIAGTKGVLTPTLTGAQPALYALDGKTVRPLGQESDKALVLLKALDEKQTKQAVLSYKLADLVLGPGQDGKKIVPEGLKASSMTDRERALLLDVISEWAGIINQASAAERMAQLKADLNDTWFSWSAQPTGRREAISPPTTGSRVRTSSSSTRHKAWVAIPPCMFTPCIAIRRTTMAGG